MLGGAVMTGYNDGLGNATNDAGELLEMHGANYDCDGCGMLKTECDCAAPYAGPWSVAVFLIDRAYGGPEEGGWYYDCGEPVIAADMPLPVFYATWEEAQDGRKLMNAEIEARGLNDGRREISSVCSDGQYRAVMSDGAPQAYPVERPFYS